MEMTNTVGTKGYVEEKVIVAEKGQLKKKVIVAVVAVAMVASLFATTAWTLIG